MRPWKGTMAEREPNESENGVEERSTRPEQARLRAEALRRRTFQAFDTRTERWQEAGLTVEVDRAAARKSLREAAVIFLVIVGVLVAFGFRDELFPGAGKAIRYTTAGVLVILGWALARTAAKGVAPVLFKRMDPGTAGTVGFLIRLATIFAVVFGSLAIAGVKLETLAVGGAFTAVVLGLAAQQTLGNVIAGAMLLSARPFRVGDRVRLQGGQIAGQLEGVVSSLGLFYVTLASGADRIMIPNNAFMQIAATPLAEPDAVELTAKFDSTSVTPNMLQSALAESITVPTRREAEIDLVEIDPDEGLTYRIAVTPVSPHRGAELASEVLDAVRRGGGKGAETDGRGQPAVDRSGITGD
jgi:small conductance mechanosensitive channel